MKVCLICNKEFKPKRSTAMYCTPECKKQAAKIKGAERRGAQIIKDCPVCGKWFEIGKDGAKTKYCSDACFKEYRRVYNKFKMRHANGLPGKESDSDRRCTICGVNISDKKYGSIYCGDSCRIKAY